MGKIQKRASDRPCAVGAFLNLDFLGTFSSKPVPIFSGEKVPERGKDGGFFDRLLTGKPFFLNEQTFHSIALGFTLVFQIE